MTPAHSVGTKDGTSVVTPKSALKEAVERVTARLREVESGHADPVTGLCTNWHRNPEGPEAADLIERQTATLEAMASALERIVRPPVGLGHSAALTRVAFEALTQYRQGDL